MPLFFSSQELDIMRDLHALASMERMRNVILHEPKGEVPTWLAERITQVEEERRDARRAERRAAEHEAYQWEKVMIRANHVVATMASR